jgi:hypothetical protein
MSDSGEIRRKSGQSGTVLYSRHALLDTPFYCGSFRAFPQPFRKMLTQNMLRSHILRSLSSIIRSYTSYSAELIFFKVTHARYANQSINLLNIPPYNSTINNLQWLLVLGACPGHHRPVNISNLI